MRVLTTNELQTLENLCRLTQKGLKQSMATLLKAKYNRVIENSKYIIAEGDIPIALVAHMDTVFTNSPKDIFYDRVKNVLWSPQGLGADDRAGIFAITQIIKKGFRPHIILTTDEEIGAYGALALAEEKCPFTDLRYMIELDRRGKCDCVFYDCDNIEFIRYVETFGFIEAIGSFSDISILMDAWGVAGVNLSIGYYNEHSLTEILSVQPMLTTINKVCQMLKAETIPVFHHIPILYPDGLYWWKDNGDTTEKCCCCAKSQAKVEMIPIKTKNLNMEYICIDCVVDKAEFCVVCGEAFEKFNNYEKVCNDCKYELFNG